MVGVGAVRPDSPVVFCPLLKKSSGNTYLKLLDFSQLYIADAPIKKKSKKLVLPPRKSLLGHPVQKKDIFGNPLAWTPGEVNFFFHLCWVSK